jgi:hypothetical protein
MYDRRTVVMNRSAGPKRRSRLNAPLPRAKHRCGYCPPAGQSFIAPLSHPGSTTSSCAPRLSANLGYRQAYVKPRLPTPSVTDSSVTGGPGSLGSRGKLTNFNSVTRVYRESAESRRKRRERESINELMNYIYIYLQPALSLDSRPLVNSNQPQESSLFSHKFHCIRGRTD